MSDNLTSQDQLLLLAGQQNLTSNSEVIAADYISGTDDDDFIEGTEDDDYIEGYGGYDEIYGYGGNDQIYGDYSYDEYYAGDDTIYGGGGRDSISGGDGYDLIAGEDGDDSLVGQSGDDTLEGGNDDDTLYGDGAPGNQSYYQGNDLLNGGEGNDFLYGDDESAESFGADTLYGGKGDDRLYADSEDLNSQSYGNNFLYGEEGNDFLYGGNGGDDYFDGGEGDDAFLYQGGWDTIIGGAGEDRLQCSFFSETDGITVTYNNPSNGSVSNGLFFSEIERIELISGTGDDTINLSAISKSLVFGNLGDDSITGGNGDDEFDGDVGNDTLIGGAGNDYLSGDVGNDTLLGGAGNDSLASDAADSVDGGAGTDRLNISSSGVTPLNVTSTGADSGTSSYGLTFTGIEQLSVNGTSGNDSVIGTAGNDSIFGELGNDTITGGAGNDYLVDNRGVGTISGGTGQDFLFINRAFGASPETNSLTITYTDPNNGTISDGTTFKEIESALIGTGTGNDTIDLSAANVNDTFQTSFSLGYATRVFGWSGNDSIKTGSGNDYLDGATRYLGSNQFSPDPDTTYGKGEQDTLTGGTGADHFILGAVFKDFNNNVVNKVYYDDNNNATAGTNDFADITDFNPSQGDVIELNGSSGDYLLSVSGSDTWIYLNKPGSEPDEAIGRIRNQTGLNLNSANFVYLSAGTPQPGTINFTSATYSVNEDGTPVSVITLTRTGGSSGAVGVTLTPSNGTAIAPADYSNAPITVSFANGETSKTVSIPIVNDTVVEGNETVNLTLSNPTGGATLGTQTTSVLTIVDNDPAPVPGAIAFSAATYSVNEDGTPVNIITLTRTGGSSGAVGVTLTPSNGTAIAPGDYSNSPITVSFANGETSKTVTVPIVNDTAYEGNETVNLTLSNPTGGATLGTQTTSVLTIVDNDPAPVPGAIAFTSATYSVNEDGTPVSVITLTRTGGSSGAVGVTLTPSNGTAIAPGDYSNAPITVSFANGETSKTVTVPVVNDTTYEGNETVNLTLSNPTGGATLGTQTSATLTIVDNDPAPVPGAIAFSSATYSVNEDGTPVNIITLTRTGGSSGAVGVTLTPSNGTAIAPADYSNSPITVSFANGETSKTVTVPVVNDTTYEGNETVNLTLSNPTGGANLGTQTSATLTIVDNDPAPVPGTIAFSAATYSVNEDGTPVNIITLTRTGGSSGAVGVTLTPSNGTAIAPGDYNNAPITVSFANGETSKTVAIPIVNDTTYEGNETVNLTLSNPTGGATLGTQTTSVLTIVDNDSPTGTLPVITLSIDPNTVNEDGSSKLNYTFNRTGDLSNALTVNFQVAGTATFNTDYTQSGATSFNTTSGTITFKAGLATAILTLDPKVDTTVELHETTILTLTTGTGYTLGTTAAITGTITNDDGDANNNQLIGGSGNDLLNGQEGKDEMSGKAGNDTYIVDNLGDKVIEQLNEGIDTVQSSINHTLAANVEKLLLLGTADLNSTGNSLDNVLTGNSGNNSLNGGAGNDTLSGGLGDDLYTIDTIADKVIEQVNAGTDSVKSSINYTLGANVEKLQLLGIDNLNGTGNILDNTINGNSGNNTLNGKEGKDTLVGGLGDDTYLVDNSSDVVVEYPNEGTDTVNSTAANYTLWSYIEKLNLSGTASINGTGNNQDNTLTGNNGNNVLKGSGGNDILLGGSGKDTLVGGLGNDTLTGGLGSDTFAFAKSFEGIDKIIDFKVVDDTIQVSASGFGGSLTSGAILKATQFIIGTGATTATHRFIYDSANGGLFFDKDGTGSISAVQIATLNPGLALTNADIFVVI